MAGFPGLISQQKVDDKAMKKPLSYTHTIYASYIGYVTQAIVNNFAPLLFLTFASEFSLTLDKITLLITVNFGVQLMVDLLSAKLADRIGYRVSIMAAHLFAAFGLVGLAIFPDLMENRYAGLLISVILYAIGGGIIEVLISPIVEACPTTEKSGEMSLLHSFYCWGQTAVVLFSTMFFHFCGVTNWRIVAFLWASIPAANLLYFALVPIYPITSEEKSMGIRELVKERTFWTMFFLMVCAGASELAMSQWASAFAEKALHVGKTVGDLLGPCAFAVLMGVSRAYYGRNSTKLKILKVMLCGGILCILCYMIAAFARVPSLGLLGCAVCGLSVGFFWPGTFSIASAKIPTGGTVMFALLALAGDLGCSFGPTVVGFCASTFGENMQTALMAAGIFPILISIGIARMIKKEGDDTNAS